MTFRFLRFLTLTLLLAGCSGEGGDADCPHCSTDGWLRSFGREGAGTYGLKIAAGLEGEVFIGGGATGPFDFGPYPAEGESHAMFVAKYDAAGEPQWVRRFERGAGTSNNTIRGMATDAEGSLYLCGNVGSELFLDEETFTPDQHLFLMKLSREGEILWARQFGGPSPGTISIDFDVTPSGEILVAGTFNGETDFGGGAVTPEPGRHVYLVAYGPNNQYRWGEVYENPGGAGYVNNVARDSQGRIVLTGRVIGGAFDFGGGPISGEEANTSFLVGLTADGDHRWTLPIGNTSTIPEDIGPGSGGEMIVAGRYGSAFSYDGLSFPNEGTDDLNLFVLGIDASGGSRWERHFRSSGNLSSFEDIAIGPDGAVHLCGMFRQRLRLPNDEVLEGPGSVGGQGGLLLSLTSSDRRVARAVVFGDVLADRCYGVDTDAIGNVVFTGQTSATLEIDSMSASPVGEYDAFAAKLVGP